MSPAFWLTVEWGKEKGGSAMRGEPSDKSRFAPARRPPPDYTQRSVKLKLFLFVAAIMVVLAAVERLRDKQTWQWLAKIDRHDPRDTFTSRLDASGRTVNDPAGTFVSAAKTISNESPAAAIDPVDRAWDQGWKDVHTRLASDDRSLLFETVHAAVARRALAA